MAQCELQCQHCAEPLPCPQPRGHERHDLVPIVGSMGGHPGGKFVTLG